jgi:hypothetical protein
MHVLEGRVDVGLDLCDVAGVLLAPGGRHQLHDADRANLALGVLIQP